MCLIIASWVLLDPQLKNLRRRNHFSPVHKSWACEDLLSGEGSWGVDSCSEEEYCCGSLEVCFSPDVMRCEVFCCLLCVCVFFLTLLLSSVSLSHWVFSNFYPQLKLFQAFFIIEEKIVSHETNPYFLHDLTGTPLVWDKLIFWKKNINPSIFSILLNRGIFDFENLEIWKFLVIRCLWM